MVVVPLTRSEFDSEPCLARPTASKQIGRELLPVEPCWPAGCFC